MHPSSPSCQPRAAAAALASARVIPSLPASVSGRITEKALPTVFHSSSLNRCLSASTSSGRSGGAHARAARALSAAGVLRAQLALPTPPHRAASSGSSRREGGSLFQRNLAASICPSSR
eukprot:scaffold230701_cov37-Tisochrysis_lutea.AAC.1